MFKLQVNIPDELLFQIDEVAREKYLNRTSLVTLLLAEGIQRHKANAGLANAGDAFKLLNGLMSSDVKDIKSDK